MDIMLNIKKMNNKGFTLIELLVATCAGMILMAAMYATYRGQSTAHSTERLVVDMQENLRVAMHFLTSDLRMAGYDPSLTGQMKFQTAQEGQMVVWIDDRTNPDGVVQANEVITYALTNDADGDGINDGGPCHLGRQIGGGGLQALAENIDAIDFEYYDTAGNLLLNGAVNPNAVPAADLASNDIAYVQVTIVARAGEVDQGMIKTWTDNTIYTTPSGRVVLPAQNDDVRRRMLSFQVKCRNG
jgi:type IV pilus assembly protein PilW